MKLENTQLTSLTKSLKKFSRYNLLAFCLLVAGLCAYLVLQIGQATSIEPTPAEQLTSVKASPRIDPELVTKLQQLQDNSVSVKSLFNDARSNPFQ